MNRVRLGMHADVAATDVAAENKYIIKRQAAAIAAVITPDAESASLLSDALLRISQEPDIPGAPAGYINTDRLTEIFREILGGRRGWDPDEGEWWEYRLDRGVHSATLCYKNKGYGSTISISYSQAFPSWGVATQEILECAFETMFGGGRIYRPTDSGLIIIYRTKREVECLTPELEAE